MLRALLVAVLAAVAWAPSAVAATQLPPTPKFRHYTVADGLPSSRVYTTAQDHRGYIWVGTGDGLARFDGLEFKLFRHDPRDPRSLGGNDISTLLVDAAGRLWAGGGEGGGLNRLLPDGSGFRHWRHDPAVPASLAGDNVMDIVQAADGRIWVGVYAGGVDRLRADGTGFDHFSHREGDPRSLVSNQVFALHATASGRIWVGTAEGLDVIELDGTVRHIEFPGMPEGPWVWQIRGSDDQLRVSTVQGLFVVADGRVSGHLQPGGVVDGAVFASFRGHNGDVWVAARDSLYLLTAHGAVHRFQPQPLLPGGLPAHIITDVRADGEGGLWLSSPDAGLIYLSPDWRQFSRFIHRPGGEHDLRGNRIMALASSTGDTLLVGGISGHLDRLDPATGRVQPVAGSAALPDTSIVSLAQDAKGSIWVGTRKGLYRLRDQGLEKIDNPSLDGLIGSIVQGPRGLLVAPILRGVYRVDPSSLRVRRIALAFAAEGDKETMGMARIDGRIWRASKAGLSRLKADGTAFVAVDGVEPGQVNAFDLRDGALWLVRPSSLEQYRMAGAGVELVRRVTVEQGFPLVDMNRLFIDREGRVWLTSRMGLWRFDPVGGSFRRYGLGSGLPSPVFTNALVQRADGIVLAGTYHGIVGFRPGALQQRLRRPELVLERISVLRDGRRVALEPEHGRVAVDWDESGLRLTVQALSYVQPEHNHYRFRMHGFDSAWVSTGTRGTREFTGLPAGRHVLQVQAAGLSGVWAGLPGKLVFEVALPPWRTAWAWALYLLAALLLALLVWQMLRARLQRRLRVGLLEEQRRLAEQANEAKTRFLATMGHEIRTPMTGVLGMAELLTTTDLDSHQGDMVRTIRHSGELLLKLVNDALDMARIEADRFQLDAEPLDPVAVMREVAALEQGLAGSKGIELRVEHGEGVPGRVIGDAIRLRQILLNLLSNALKFTDEGAVVLSLTMDGDSLCYRVADSGPGMDVELQQRLFRRFEQGEAVSHSGGSGLGLAISKELTTLMGGRIAVDTEAGVGSTFVVTLPLPISEAASRPGDEAVDTTQCKRRQVLLVEDDATVAQVMVGLLRNQGHAVVHVGHALAALAEVDSGDIDTLLVDLDLPDLNGFELIRMLRARADGQSWHIVVVTARSNRDDERRAREAGADDFLRKPVSGKQLRAVLDSA